MMEIFSVDLTANEHRGFVPVRRMTQSRAKSSPFCEIVAIRIRSTGLSLVVLAREYELGRLEQLLEELSQLDRQRFRRNVTL
jgi:hypothetical protein